MDRWTVEESEFMDYLDGVAGDLPGGHSFGLLLAKGDPIAFRVGLSDWITEREYEREEATAQLGGYQGDIRRSPRCQHPTGRTLA